MKLLRIFSLAIISFLALVIFTPVQAQEETNSEELANVLVEFESDEVDAKTLEIDEVDALPGQFKYNWQLFKENTGLFFTFDKEKKVKKLEEISNRRLLEAKKLAEIGTDNAANRVEDALKRYEAARQKISDRLEANPELKEKLLEKFDSNQLKHQQVLSTVTEKLRNKIPEDKLNKLEDLKKANALRWYNANKDDIQARLEKAIDNNNVGSKFKQLKNIATLEELGDNLPDEARGKIEAAQTRAEEKLSEKLKNLDSSDKEKFEKYINNIKTPELTKQKFISNLKDSEKLPPAVKEKAKNIFDNYSNQLQDKFKNLDEAGQKRFLNQFENKLRSHPANIQFLENLDSPENRTRIKNLLETQSEGIKEKIQRTTDPAKLRSLENNLRNNPVLRRQIQQRQIEVKRTPTLDARSTLEKSTPPPSDFNPNVR
jgi:ribosomal protein S17E